MSAGDWWCKMCIEGTNTVLIENPTSQQFLTYISTISKGQDCNLIYLFAA